MHSDLLEFLTPREESITLAGQPLVVREMPAAADIAAFRDNEDHIFKLIVRCTFTADGDLAFSDAHIPALKAAPRLKLAPLINAVVAVNALDEGAEIKNSEAGTSAG